MGAGRSNGLRVVPESWAKLSNVKQCQAMSFSTVSTFTQKSDFEHPLHH